MEPVGGSTRIRVDARVLAATNKDLPAEIRAGRFREDLYFRLNVVPIFVPPLRERGEDIALLADHFMAMLAREYGRRPKTFDADAVAALQRYPWPGNVRELRNLVERLMIMVPGDRVSSRDLTLPRAGPRRDAAHDGHRRRRSRRCTMRATSSKSSTSCGRWRRSKATCRGPPKCSVSSAATCIEKCGRSGSCRRAEARMRSRFSIDALHTDPRHSHAGAARGRLGARSQHRPDGRVFRQRPVPAAAARQSAQDTGHRASPAGRRILRRTDMRDGV